MKVNPKKEVSVGKLDVWVWDIDDLKNLINKELELGWPI